ncbi:hypothetical protein [Promicromonospora sukumoe]|uniref:hypothetical protein n=1 Tax=Promicromonospora sukumoe TaxID=88382 RepID=UPI00364AE5FA
MGLFDKAKEFVTDPDNVAKAKEQLTDERIDGATERLKELAPDKADGAIDSLGERAKDWNGTEEPERGGAERRQAGGGRD